MKKKSNLLTIDEALDENKAIDKEDKMKPKSDKKMLARMEKNIRKLDNIISSMSELQNTAFELAGDATTIDGVMTEKDRLRSEEFANVVDSALTILYHLNARMARKHLGKEIEPADTRKRKSLKMK